MKGKVFTAQEVQAIIAGNKTQFRDVIRPQIIKLSEQENKNLSLVEGYTFNNEVWADLGKCKKAAIFRCPYQVGQKIFCKEAWLNDSGDIFYPTYYPASMTEEELFAARHVIKRPAQHMKQEHSRLTLLIKEIRVERLADISEEDAVSEGIPNGAYAINPKARFKELWNSTHKKPEEKFEESPFVWLISFEVKENE